MLIAEFGHSNSQAPQLVHSEAMIWYAMISSPMPASCIPSTQLKGLKLRAPHLPWSLCSGSFRVFISFVSFLQLAIYLHICSHLRTGSARDAILRKWLAIALIAYSAGKMSCGSRL